LISLNRLALGDIELRVLSLPARPQAWPAVFTEAEREIAGLLIDGRSYREIAATRGASEHTVAVQVSMMMEKLGVDSSHRLVARLASDSVR